MQTTKKAILKELEQEMNQLDRRIAENTRKLRAMDQLCEMLAPIWKEHPGISVGEALAIYHRRQVQ